jgi:hypothetical protein
MKVTSINKLMKRCAQWWGTASSGDEKYEWFYEPRSYVQMRKEEPQIPGCFMNIDPPAGAKEAILKAVRGEQARSATGVGMV